MLLRTAISHRREENHGKRERRNRKAVGRGKALFGLAKAMGRGANLRMARAMPQADQGLGASESQEARLRAIGIRQTHAQKIMQSIMNFADRLLGLRSTNAEINI